MIDSNDNKVKSKRWNYDTGEDGSRPDGFSCSTCGSNNVEDGFHSVSNGGQYYICDIESNIFTTIRYPIPPSRMASVTCDLCGTKYKTEDANIVTVSKRGK